MEFQSRIYDAMVSHTAIVFTRYTILEWIRRKENDEKPMVKKLWSEKLYDGEKNRSKTFGWG